MIKKTKVIWLSLLIIVLVVVVGVFVSLQVKYSDLEKSLKAHLINVGGYAESDILSIKAELSSMPKYPVYVRFADDPETDYIFTDGDDGDSETWYQLDPKNPQRLKD